METRHAAIVSISFDFLLRLMEFQDGVLHRAYTKDEYLEASVLYMVVEHPDLPAVPIGAELSEVTVALHTECGENGVPIKIERVDPPKQNVVEK